MTVRLGTPISGYGQESRNRAARQRIPHRAYTDSDGVEHHHVSWTGSCSRSFLSILSVTRLDWAFALLHPAHLISDIWKHHHLKTTSAEPSQCEEMDRHPQHLHTDGSSVDHHHVSLGPVRCVLSCADACKRRSSSMRRGPATRRWSTAACTRTAASSGSTTCCSWTLVAPCSSASSWRGSSTNEGARGAAPDAKQRRRDVRCIRPGCDATERPFLGGH